LFSSTCLLDGGAAGWFSHGFAVQVNWWVPRVQIADALLGLRGSGGGCLGRGPSLERRLISAFLTWRPCECLLRPAVLLLSTLEASTSRQVLDGDVAVHAAHQCCAFLLPPFAQRMA